MHATPVPSRLAQSGWSEKVCRPKAFRGGPTWRLADTMPVDTNLTAVTSQRDHFNMPASL